MQIPIAEFILGLNLLMVAALGTIWYKIGRIESRQSLHLKTHHPEVHDHDHSDYYGIE